MLAYRITTDADGTVLGDIGPEVLGCRAVGGGAIAADLVDADEAHILGHLSIGVLAVEEGLVERLHTADHARVAVTLGTGEVLRIAKQLVGIGDGLVHTAMLRPEHALQGIVREFADHVECPVAHLAEHLAGDGGTLVVIAVSGIDGDVAQAGQNLVLTVEGHGFGTVPETIGIALVELLPVGIHGLTAYETVESCLIIVVGILAVLDHLDDIVDALQDLGLQCLVVAAGVGESKSRHVMAADMTTEVEIGASPVGMVRMLRLPLVVLVLGIGGGT